MKVTKEWIKKLDDQTLEKMYGAFDDNIDILLEKEIRKRKIKQLKCKKPI
jgi:hypothetical protein